MLKSAQLYAFLIKFEEPFKSFLLVLSIFFQFYNFTHISIIFQKRFFQSYLLESLIVVLDRGQHFSPFLSQKFHLQNRRKYSAHQTSIKIDGQREMHPFARESACGGTAAYPRFGWRRCTCSSPRRTITGR